MLCLPRRSMIVVSLAVVLLSSGCGYNDIQAGDEAVKASWAEISNQYQRRADLIPNLVNTVKGAADFERETLEAVVQARSKATSIEITPELVNDPEALQRFMDSVQDRVHGEARLKLYKGGVTIEGRRSSSHALYDEGIATFEADDVYDQSDATGFIRLRALRLRTLGARRISEGE